MIPLARPDFGSDEERAVAECLRSGWVTQGPRVLDFEKQFADRVGSKNAIAVSNCTCALQLALFGVGVQPGDVVITVSHSFIATANSVRAVFAEPVFIDVSFEDFGMDPAALSALLESQCERRGDELFYKGVEKLAVGYSPLAHFKDRSAKALGRVAAIVAVHQMGFPCRIFEIAGIAARFRIPVIEDAACAIGSELLHPVEKKWVRIGRPVSGPVCFSFHPRKVITTGDGGMITTNSASEDALLRRLRQHGMSVSDLARHRAASFVQEEYLDSGFNFRLTDIQAALGGVQLAKLDQILTRRNAVAKLYADRLKDIGWLALYSPAASARVNWQSCPILLSKESGWTSERLVSRLLENGVQARPGIMNAHTEPPYRAQGWTLPLSEELRRRTVLLPLFPSMTEAEVEEVASVLRQASY